MAKDKKNVDQVAAEDVTTETAPNYAPDEVLAHIICDDEGNFHVKDLKTGEVGPSCKFCDADDRTIVLTPNSSNRKWANRAKAKEAIDKDGFFPLCYKASRHIGEGTRGNVPNQKMVEWYRDNAEDGQAIYDEYMAIVNKAIAAREADKAKPKTDLEKAQEKLAKVKAAYEKLLAEAEEGK